jgi:hypothetical protein
MIANNKKGTVTNSAQYHLSLVVNALLKTTVFINIAMVTVKPLAETDADMMNVLLL